MTQNKKCPYCGTMAWSKENCLNIGMSGLREAVMTASGSVLRAIASAYAAPSSAMRIPWRLYAIGYRDLNQVKEN